MQLASDLTWSEHINKTTAKANKQLGFLKRIIPIQNIKLKEIVYMGLERPILEYCAPIWHPHHKKYIQKLEMVQRQAARFALADYHSTNSVTEMLNKLKWESLEHRRRRGKLVIYKIQYSLIAVPIPPIVIRPDNPRPGHPHHFRSPFCNTEAYKNRGFFPRAIRNWNALPPCIACHGSLSLFQTAL